jgi:4'-phosphopantetheinyl transferase
MIELGPCAVHVWHRLTDEIGAAEHAAAMQRLPADERDRASRFVFDRDRVPFVAAHDLLRFVLSQYEAVAPDAWRFTLDTHGKPLLSDLHAPCRLRFNLSHTRGLVACAVSRSIDVGIDVEAIRGEGDSGTGAHELAARFFSPREVASLGECPQDTRQERFIEFWTLKEAYVKAIGEGLSHPLDTFAFTLADAQAIRFEAPPGDDERSWRFALYAPSEGHRMAVAARPGASAGVVEITLQAQLPWSRPACILARSISSPGVG